MQLSWTSGLAFQRRRWVCSSSSFPTSCAARRLTCLPRGRLPENARVELLRQQRQIKQYFLEQPGAAAALDNVKHMLKVVRSQLKSLAQDAELSRKLMLEQQLQQALDSNEMKEVWRYSRQLSARNLGPRNRYFRSVRSSVPSVDQ